MDILDKEKGINIIIGKSFSMYGVSDIRGFDEGFVSLDTSLGKISIEGKDLKIESLSKEDGRIYVKGDICGVFLDSESEKNKGFIKRMLGR